MKKIWHSASSIRFIYALCLTGATFNHAKIFVEHGLIWDYGGVPFFVSRFWTALTFVDALAVILLLRMPVYGVALTAAIILADVAINLWVGIFYGFDVAAFSAQVLFLIFVLSTLRASWNVELRKVSARAFVGENLEH